MEHEVVTEGWKSSIHICKRGVRAPAQQSLPAISGHLLAYLGGGTIRVIVFISLLFLKCDEKIGVGVGYKDNLFVQ